MKFYLLITLITLLMLKMAPSELHHQTMAPLALSGATFKASFKKAENASVAWALLTGDKGHMGAQTIHAFKELNLTFLFHPSGLQLSSLLLLIHFLIKKFLTNSKKRWFTLLCPLPFFFLPFLSLKRVILLRTLNASPLFKKSSYRLEILFFICFIFCFLLGHYSMAPGSFIASFLYIGTFIALADQPKRQWLLALIANQFLLALFWQLSFNPIATVMSLPLLLLTSWLTPLGYGYLFTFRWLSFNWIEGIFQLYLSIIKISAKLAHSFASSPSVMFFILVWMLLLKAPPRWIGVTALICASTAVAPTISY